MKRFISRNVAIAMALFMVLCTFSGCKKGPQYESYFESYYDETPSGTDNSGSDNNSVTGSNGDSGNNGSIGNNGDIGNNGNTGNNGDTANNSGTGNNGGGSNTDLPSKLDNPKIKVYSWYAFDTKNKDDVVTRAYNAYAKKYGANNIDLQVVAGEDAYKQKIVALVSSGDVPDIMRVKSDWMPQYAISNFVKPVNNILDTASLTYQGMVKEMSYKGQNYVACNDGFFSNVVWYNKTLFNKFGVKTPKQYYDAGEWTWENFRKAAKEMTQGGIWGFAAQDFKVLTASAMDAQPVTYNSANGAFTSNLTGTKFYDALKVTQEMIHVDKSWNPDITYVTKQFKNKKVAMSYSNVAFPGDQAGLTDTLEYVPAPVQNKGDAHTTMGFGIFWAIGNGQKVNLDASVAFIKMLRTEYGIDYKDNVRTEHEKFLTDEQFKSLRKLSDNGLCYSSNRISAWLTQYQYGFFQRICEKNKPIATVIDEYKPLLNKCIDELNK